MADIMEQVADLLARIVGGTGTEIVPSAAPGGGPEAARESDRPAHPGTRIGSHIPRGRSPLGYGGYGDPVELAPPDVPKEVQQAVTRHLRQEADKARRMPKPSGRLRISKPFAIEAHVDDEWHHVAGPYSMFDGTIPAPGAANSLIGIPISLPTNIPSPVILLDRYPGAQYVSLFLRTFSYMPTGTTMTGVQELYFIDAGGAVAGLGIFLASAQTSGAVAINAFCNSPITDPGNTQLGTLFVNNIGIGGTPVTARYQINLTFTGVVPDPYFNERVIEPPTPTEIADALRTQEA